MSENPHVRPGELEIHTGPMKSKKSLRLMMRIDDIGCKRPQDVLIAKPMGDTRESAVSSRFGELSYDQECIDVDELNPRELLKYVNGTKRVVALDEVQFFDKQYIEFYRTEGRLPDLAERLQIGIEGVVLELMRREINVILAGLDTSYRGEPFLSMEYLMSIAQYVDKRPATCDYEQGGERCNQKAFWTQRLLNGEPAPYDDPLIYVESPEGVDDKGDRRTYEARCTKHHLVPGRPY